MPGKLINFELPKDLSSIIKVIGVGGGGSNAVNHMFNEGIKGVDFVVCNTDSQDLDSSPVPHKIQLGASLTEGLGAGGDPEVGRNAALENIEQIKEILGNNTKMAFITAGMGGGTGTGGAPVIASVARESGILTVGIVTIPFSNEGPKRRQQAEEGLNRLRESVDALIIICNDKLREMYGNLGLSTAFLHADNVLGTAVKGIAEMISVHGTINADFRDVKTVMKNSGVAIMGSGKANGENRAIKAVEQALASPLLNDNKITGAMYVLLNITTGTEEPLLDEITEISDYIQLEAGNTANVILGVGTNMELEDNLNVTIIAAGFNTNPDLGFTGPKQPERIVRILGETDSPKAVYQNTKETTEKEKADDADTHSPAITFKGSAGLIEPLAVQEPGITDKQGENEELLKFKMSTKKPEEKQTNFEFVLNPLSKKKTSSAIPLFKDPKPHTSAAQQVSSLQSEGSVNAVDKFKSPGQAVRPGSMDSNKAKERINKLKELSYKLKTPSGVSDLENQPAYMRRNISLDEIPHSSA